MKERVLATSVWFKHRHLHNIILKRNITSETSIMSQPTSDSFCLIPTHIVYFLSAKSNFKNLKLIKIWLKFRNKKWRFQKYFFHYFLVLVSLVSYVNVVLFIDEHESAAKDMLIVYVIPTHCSLKNNDNDMSWTVLLSLVDRYYTILAV